MNSCDVCDKDMDGNDDDESDEFYQDTGDDPLHVTTQNGRQMMCCSQECAEIAEEMIWPDDES